MDLNLCVIEYLQKKAASVTNQTEYKNALNVIASSLSVNMSNSSGYDLEAIVANQVPVSDSQEEEKWKKYLELLQKRGYFNGAVEGSEEYKSRFDKARDRFFKAAKTAQNTTSTTSTATTTTTSSLPTQPDLDDTRTPEEREKIAEKYKEEGNEFFKIKKYAEAVDAYTKAIKANPKNSVYWSNRGLAHSRLNNHHECVNDQKEAIKCNVQYDKAYSRLGGAYAAMNQIQDAVKAYEDCLALNPADTAAKLELEKLKKPQGGPPIPGFPGLGGGAPPNLMEMLNNPQFMDMAARMMENNPQIMQMAQQVAQNPDIMRQFFGGNMPPDFPQGPPQ